VGWDSKGAPGNRYGHNYRITEMQAVLLRGGLKRLADQTQRREESAAMIREGLAAMGGPLRAARRDPRITRQAYYGMTLVYDSRQALGMPKQAYLNALAAEGCPMWSTYWPVYAAPLLNLYDRTSPVPFRDQKKIQNYRDLKLPNTEKAVNETAVILSHTHMLGNDDYIGELLAAVRKVNENLPEAKKAWGEQQAAAKK